MIALFGSGKTTQALAQEIKDVTFFEDIETPYQDKEGFWHYPTNNYGPSKFSLSIPSPGIPPHHPLIERSQNLISEYDFFASQMPFSIWISGTNGKTTTTQMIAHLLDDKPIDVGGNIGKPLAKMDKSAKIWILETSSFTLHYTKLAKPNLYILLPITPDHLSWHGSFEEYERAKLKSLANLQEGEIAIVPKKYLNIPTKGYLIGYEEPKELAKIFGFNLRSIPFKGAFLLDALLALAVDKILFFRTQYQKIATFNIDPHKQEEFLDKESRVWVDDSKATNIDATIEALKRYRGKRLFLILGGDNKGVDLEPLFAYIPKEAKIFAIGKAAEDIIKLAQKYGIWAQKTRTLQNAVNAIKQLHTKESIALLSPACASLDQFASYKERGEKFKEYVLSSF